LQPPTQPAYRVFENSASDSNPFFETDMLHHGRSIDNRAAALAADDRMFRRVDAHLTEVTVKRTVLRTSKRPQSRFRESGPQPISKLPVCREVASLRTGISARHFAVMEDLSKSGQLPDAPRHARNTRWRPTAHAPPCPRVSCMLSQRGARLHQPRRVRRAHAHDHPTAS
jgi:hypothetical protein